MSRRSPRPNTSRRSKRPVDTSAPETPASIDHVADGQKTELGPDAEPASPAEENKAPELSPTTTTTSDKDDVPSIILADDLLADETTETGTEPPPDEDEPKVENRHLLDDEEDDDPAPVRQDEDDEDDEEDDEPEPLRRREDADNDPNSGRKAPRAPAEEMPTRGPQKTSADSDKRGEAEPAVVKRAGLDRVPLPTRSRPAAPLPETPVQRYTVGKLDGPVELPKYVEETPRRSWDPPILDEDIDLRPDRRRYNWLLALAAVIVGALGVALGTRSTGPQEGATDPEDQADAAALDADTLEDDSESTDAARGDAGPGDATTDTNAKNRPDVPPPPPETARAMDEGKRALDERRFEDALVAFDKALTQTPDNPRALFGRARAYQQLGRLADALTDAGALLARDTTHPYGLLLAGDTLAQLGRQDEARAHYERYLTAWPKTRRAEELRKQLGVPDPK